jgi:penicillin amidase
MTARRAVGIAAIGAAAIGIGVAGLIAWRLQAMLPTTAGTMTLPGLTDEVTVIRDRAGVPHIFAAADVDAARALGFVQAQDRRYAMALARAVAAGRLAELVGDLPAPIEVAGVQASGTVDFDRQMRTFGLERLAAAEVELLAPANRVLLDAHAAGVNAATTGGAGGLARLLGMPLDLWTSADTLVVLKLSALLYANQRWEELRAGGLVAEVGRAAMADFIPPYPVEWAPPVVPDPRATSPAPRAGPAGLPVATGAHLPTGCAACGSNNWVLAGARTTTGMPILANDPHLDVAIPGAYVAHVSAPGLEVIGTTFGPVFFNGHNARIAWGITVVNPDSQDLFVEEIAAGDPPRVRTPDGWEPLRLREEVIRIRGRDDPVTHVVRETSHGPIVYDWTPDDVRRAYGTERGPGESGSRYATALAWSEGTPLSPDASFALARAGDWQSFRDALRTWNGAAFNFVYADVDGHIGYQLAGRIPLREGPAPETPALGWERGHAWIGSVPFDDLPSLFDPPEGVIVTANAHAVGSGYPRYLASRWGDVPLRQRRIRELLDAKATLSLDDVAAVQLDVREGRAETLVAWARSVASDDPDVRRFQDALAGWDLRADVASMPAALAEAFRVELVQTVFAPRLSPEAFPLYLWAMPGVHQAALERILDDPGARFFAPEPTAARAARDEAVRRAIRRAIERLRTAMGTDWSAWRWGRMHTVTFRHPLTMPGSPLEPLLGRFLNLGPFEAPGGAFTVWAGQWRPTAPFELWIAPLYRQVVDLGDLRRSRWQPPVPGQSEHPLSPHYGDQVTPWLAGRLRPMLWSRPDIEAEAEATLVLRPPAGGDQG